MVLVGIAPILLAAPGEPKKIEVVAHKYAFEPAKIEVRAGEPVEITLPSTKVHIL
jgi:plastocyanin